MSCELSQTLVGSRAASRSVGQIQANRSREAGEPLDIWQTIDDNFVATTVCVDANEISKELERGNWPRVNTQEPWELLHLSSAILTSRAGSRVPFKAD